MRFFSLGLSFFSPSYFTYPFETEKSYDRIDMYMSNKPSWLSENSRLGLSLILFAFF
jgi:hypothetical protein